MIYEKSLVRIIQYGLVTKNLVQDRQLEEELPYLLLRLLIHCSKRIVQAVSWNRWHLLKRKKKRVDYIEQVVGCINVNEWRCKTKLVLTRHPFLHADYLATQCNCWSRISSNWGRLLMICCVLAKSPASSAISNTIQSTSSLCCYCSFATFCTSMTTYAIKLLYVCNNIHSRLELWLLVVVRYSWFIILCCTVIG